MPADQLLRLPATTADEAGWKAVHSRLGVPAEAKDYDLSSVKFADGTELEQAFADSIRGALHAAKVSKDAAPAIVKAVVKYLDDADSAESATKAAKLGVERAELDKNWGANKDFNLLKAMEGARRLGITDAEVEALKSTVGGARIMEMFRRVGASTSEAQFVEGDRGGVVTTTAGAVARKDELMKDQAKMKLYLEGDPALVREMQALNIMIAGAAA